MTTPEVTATSVTTTTEPPAPTVVPPPKAETAPSAELTKALAEVEKWKALSRKNEEQAKGNAGAVTERDQLAERLTTLEREAADAKAEALRLKVAADKGVPAHMLHGTTEQELSAEADALVEFRGALAPPRSVTPQEAGAGKQGTGSAARGPADEFADYITQQLRRS